MSLTWRELSAILDNPIAFHRIFGRIGGGACAGLFMSQAFYWTKVQDRTNPDADGWFYKTQAEWELETCLTRYEQESSRTKWRNLGCLEEKKQGVPAKLYFRINKVALLEAISSSVHMDDFKAAKPCNQGCGKPTSKDVEKPHTRMAESPELVRGKAPGKDVENPHTLDEAENTSENTQTSHTVDKSKEENRKGRFAPLVYETYISRQRTETRIAIRTHPDGPEKYLETYHAAELLAVADELGNGP